VPFWLESTTNVRYNSQKDDSDNLYYESGSDTRQQGMSVLDSLFCLGVALNDPSMISARKRWTKAKAKEYGASQSFDFSKNLYSGDIIRSSQMPNTPRIHKKQTVLIATCRGSRA
jgi:hypothetical protein